MKLYINSIHLRTPYFSILIEVHWLFIYTHLWTHIPNRIKKNISRERKQIMEQPFTYLVEYNAHIHKACNDNLNVNFFQQKNHSFIHHVHINTRHLTREEALQMKRAFTRFSLTKRKREGEYFRKTLIFYFILWY